jgi:hypothetical protein
MRPCSRRGLFAEMGVAMLLDLGETFLALSIGGAIPLLIWQPWAVFEALVSPFYLVVALANLLMFGLVMRIMRFRVGWLSAISILLAPIAAAFITAGFFWINAMILYRQEPAPANPFAYLAIPIWLLCGLLTIAIVLICSTYSVWCDADLD